MHKISKFIVVVIAASTLMSVPAMAGNGFNTTLSQPLSQPVKVEVSLSESLAHRANNLPKKLSMRNSSGRLNSGFSSNGFYGEKDLQKLQDRLLKKLTQRFTKYGVSQSDVASATLKVTIEDARNNRPTFEQISREVGLSQQSFANGGAEISAVLVSADGTELGTMEYSFFENNIEDAYFSGTWSDANRSIDRFAKRAAKTLSEPSRS